MPSPVDAVEQPAGDLREVGGEVGRLRERARAGDGAEVAEAHLELHRARRLAAPPGAGSRPCRRGAPPRARARRGRSGRREGLLVADRLHATVGLDRRVVAVPRERVEVLAVRVPERARRASPPGSRRARPTVCTPSRSSRRTRGRADPPQPLDRQRVQERRARRRARRRGGRRAWRGRSRASRAAWWSATPTDATRPVSARTRPRISAAISGPGRGARRTPATSRNASSSAIGSTSGVNERRIAMTARLAARYASKRGARNTASGQARRARAIGIAEWMPKRRAS